MKNKLRLSYLCLGMLTVLAVTPVVRAQGQPQEASLELTPGSTYHRFVPENFGIGPIFIDKAQTETIIYKTLPPGLTEEDLTPTNIVTNTMPNQFVLEDAQGAEFNVTLHISNLIDGNKVIPFEQISLVTLANDPSGLDSFNTNTPPADTVGVSAPVRCLGWSSTTTDLQSACPELAGNYFLTNSPTAHPSDPQTDIGETQTVITVNPAPEYKLNEIIEFASGEKALITLVSPDNSQITVRRGMLGTTASPQTAGTGITGYGPSSKSVTIMEGLPFPSRIGSYSVGFGFLLKVISSSFEPGNYSGIITIDTIVTS